MAGRPSTFTEEIGARICQEMAEGKSFRAVCRTEGMPHASTVCRWLAQNATFREQYTRAREAMADAMFEELIEIADDSTRDFIETDKGPAFNSEHVQRSKLRVEARKWAVSKISPKKYGDKLDLDATVNGALTIVTGVKRDGD